MYEVTIGTALTCSLELRGRGERMMNICRGKIEEERLILASCTEPFDSLLLEGCADLFVLVDFGSLSNSSYCILAAFLRPFF